MSSKHCKPVFFLAFANDRTTTNGDAVNYLRNLPEEARRLLAALEGARAAGLCEIVIRQNATLDDMLAVFQHPDYRNRIALFHYAGHANGYQLLLERADGHTAAAYAGGLAAFLAQQRGLSLVFLNGCSTEPQVQGLLDAGIAVVIATSQAIDDQVATLFAARFYQGLASGISLAQAYNEAVAALRAEQGDNTRNFYLAGTEANIVGPTPTHSRWPWSLYQRAGAELAAQWNLPNAAQDPLFGLPTLPAIDLPAAPFRHLGWFRREDAPIFFGRGYQIRDLYSRITDTTGAPIILFYGQSGVGKSSLLAAGLLPRLAITHAVRYLRRERDSGLLGALAAAIALRDPAASVDQWCAAWLNLEANQQQPLVVIIDQVEELYTRPNPDNPDELTAFLAVVQGLLGEQANRPQGKLILSFRKEWLAEIEKHLAEQQLPRAKVFLERLDLDGIVEAIEGIANQKQLQRHYGLTVQDGLAAEIAGDLLEDRGAAVAPTLQILLTKLWERAQAQNYDHPYFDQNLYFDLRRQGLLLGDFLDQQLTSLQQIDKAAVDSGLALDLLAFHTTPLGTAEQRTLAELRENYRHQTASLPTLLRFCQELYLLTDPSVNQPEGEPISRLVHDTLAPLVRHRFDESDAAGPRARRILESRRVDWQAGAQGTPLDEADLQLVDAGLSGMRGLTADEEYLLAASRAARDRREVERHQIAVERELTHRRELQLKRQSWQRLQMVAGILAVVSLALLGNYLHPTFVSWQTRGRLATIADGIAVLGTNDPTALANEHPRTLVSLAAYAIEKYEVTNQQYRQCVKVYRCSPSADLQRLSNQTLSNHPVVDITALQAADYCRWIGRRLPTEAEWEFAARGTEGRLWPWGNVAPTRDYANMPLGEDNFFPEETKPVNEMAAGRTIDHDIYQLAGNIWEWTASYPTKSYVGYDKSRAWDSQDASTLQGKLLVLRGGSWDLGTERITKRIIYPANKHTNSYGFRCAE